MLLWLKNEYILIHLVDSKQENTGKIGEEILQDIILPLLFFHPKFQMR